MRKIFFAALVIISFASSAQTWTGISGKYRYTINLGIPVKIPGALTAADSAQIIINPVDSSLYFVYKGSWRKAGVGGTDTNGFIQNQDSIQQSAKAWYDSTKVSNLITGNYSVLAPQFSRQTPYNSYTAFGNSITSGYYSSAMQKAYAYLIGQHVQIATDDRGVPGDQSADQQATIYPTVVGANNQLYTLMVGSNDVTQYGTNANKQTNFQLFALADAAFLCIPDTFKIKGQSTKATYTGTWSNATTYYGGAISKQSSTNGDNVSFSLTGTTLYIAYTMLDGNGGTANVVIDGGSPVAITNYGTAGTAIATINGQTYGSACLRVAGLSAGSHTVSITITSATSVNNQVIFDWAAGNSFAAQLNGPTVMQGQIPFRFTQSGFSSYNPLVDSNIARLKRDGLNIFEALTENVIPIPSGIAADGAHPNDIGHAALYNAFRVIIDSLNSITNYQLNTPAIYRLPSSYANSAYGNNIVDGTGWTSTGWTGSWSTGWTHTAGGVDTLSYPIQVIAGNKYNVTFGVNSVSGGSCTVKIGTTTVTTISGAGLTTVTVQPTSSGNLIFIPTTSFVRTIRSISVQQVLSQSPPMQTVYIDSVLATETRIGLNYNLGIGTGSLANVTSGAYNQAFGLLAGANITSANGNLLWGYKTGTSLFDGNHNIFIGDQTGSSNTSGDYNVAIGYQSMFNNKSQHNVALGVYTLYNSTSGNYNFASLFKALYSNTSGIDNIAIGYQALQNNTSGRYNIAFGINTLSSNVAGTANIAMGNSALMSNVVSNNVAIGDSALLSNTTGNYNTAIGKSAQISNITGVDRIAIGRNAMFTDTDGDGNIALGANSMYSQTTATHNVAIGDNAFYFNQTGVSSVAIGDRPLYANTTGDRNIAIGDHTMIGNTTGIRNIAVGVQSLSSNVSGNYNVSIGYHALDSNTTGEYNVAFGLRALSFNKTGSYNVGAGYHAMYNATGNYNIGLGSETGLTVTSGSNNVAIGNLADVPSATTDNQLSIQNMIYGINNSGTGSTVSTGFIGLGVKTPLAKLHVVGGVVASSTVNTQTIHKGVWIDITSARSGFTAYSVSPSLNSANANSYFSALYPYGDSSINNDRTMKFFSLRTGYNLEVQPFYVNKYGKGYFADTVDVGRLVIQNTATAVTGDSVLFKDPTTKVIKAATLGSMFSLSAGILNAGDYGSAYTQLVNNTNATAAYSETVYKDVGQQTLSSTITWVGTTAPSGAINHFYHWSQDGKKVTVDVNLNYTVGGTLLTEVDIDFPADLPVPETKTGLTAANSIILRGAGGLNTSKTTVSGGASAAYIAANSGATGYVIKIIQGSAASAIAAYATFTYFTP